VNRTHTKGFEKGVATKLMVVNDVMVVGVVVVVLTVMVTLLPRTGSITEASITTAPNLDINPDII